jgi:hypothetical protein
LRPGTFDNGRLEECRGVAPPCDPNARYQHDFFFARMRSRDSCRGSQTFSQSFLQLPRSGTLHKSKYDKSGVSTQ